MAFPYHARRTSLAAAVAAVLSLASLGASAALSISSINTTSGITNTLTNALLAPSSGISIVAGSETYQGTNTANIQQSATYSGFSLAPSSGSTPTLTMADGIFLTTGNANIPLTNTINNWSNPNGLATTGSGANATLGALSASAGGTSSTYDANVLSFNFTVGAGKNSVSAKFVFGTDEFPTQTVTDIFGFFVDGVNYAKFSNGELISNTPGNPTNFINNPVLGGLYGIEYNGLTQVFTVTGLFGASNADGSHTIMIGVADTSDSVWDSGVFINSLTAGTSGCGTIDCNNPEPGSLALVGLALAGVAGVGARRRK